VSNLKSVALTILVLLALTPKNFGGHVTIATPPFEKIFGDMYGQSLGTCVSNLKSIALTVSELLAVNAQKFRGSRDPGHAPFGKIFGGHVWIVPGNMCVKFEVRRFNHFGAISI